MQHGRQQHESYAAAGERIVNGKRQPFGRLAVASAYRDMLAVYRMHGTDCTNPSRHLEWWYASKGLWISAEKRLQRLTLEQMARKARANANYRVVVYDYAGRSVVLDAAQTRLRGE